MIQFQNKEFASKKELYRFLADNKDSLIAQKKSELIKKDMPVIIEPTIVSDMKIKALKAEGKPIDITSINSLKVVCIINTTNFLDSHMDVHLPGLWSKSLKDNKMIMHLQEHEMEFDKIISSGEQLRAYTRTFKWSELGYDFNGDTEALVFESEILKTRNSFMLNQYANKWVRNHSVGMFYVKMDMAINDEEMPNYYEAWKKYYPQIVNPEMADERGYFWYVLEAKCMEGSAVPIGSNNATPTLEPKNKPLQGTYNILKPDNSTSKHIDYQYLLNNLKKQ